MISVCVPVYRDHQEPNATTLAASLAAALGDQDGELVVALNGVSVSAPSIPNTAQVVDLEVNRGVSVGWNAAARAARGDVLVFANDDVVLGAKSLALLASALFERRDAGVVGPVGTRWNISIPEHTGWIDLSGRAPGEVEACEVISGFLLAVRREVFDSIGGFDEAYSPCSYEELDLCTSVRLRLGLQCLAVAGVGFEHEYRISVAKPWTRVRYDGRSETLRSIHHRNRRYFQRKWSGAR